LVVANGFFPSSSSATRQRALPGHSPGTAASNSRCAAFCDPKVLILTIFAQAQSVTLLMVPGQEIDGRFYPRKSIVVLDEPAVHRRNDLGKGLSWTAKVTAKAIHNVLINKLLTNSPTPPPAPPGLSWRNAGTHSLSCPPSGRAPRDPPDWAPIKRPQPELYGPERRTTVILWGFCGHAKSERPAQRTELDQTEGAACVPPRSDCGDQPSCHDPRNWRSGVNTI